MDLHIWFVSVFLNDIGSVILMWRSSSCTVSTPHGATTLSSPNSMTDQIESLDSRCRHRTRIGPSLSMILCSVVNWTLRLNLIKNEILLIDEASIVSWSIEVSSSMDFHIWCVSNFSGYISNYWPWWRDDEMLCDKLSCPERLQRLLPYLTICDYLVYSVQGYNKIG